MNGIRREKGAKRARPNYRCKAEVSIGGVCLTRRFGEIIYINISFDRGAAVKRIEEHKHWSASKLHVCSGKINISWDSERHIIKEQLTENTTSGYENYRFQLILLMFCCCVSGHLRMFFLNGECSICYTSLVKIKSRFFRTGTASAIRASNAFKKRCSISRCMPIR